MNNLIVFSALLFLSLISFAQEAAVIEVVPNYKKDNIGYDGRPMPKPVLYKVRENINKRKNRPVKKSVDVYELNTLIKIRQVSPENRKLTCTESDLFDYHPKSGLENGNLSLKEKVLNCQFVHMSGYCYKTETKQECEQQLIEIFKDEMNVLKH